MPAPELEDFFDRGKMRAWWGLNWWTAGGLAVGAVLGQQLGTIFYGNQWPMAVFTIVGAVLGFWLMLSPRGLHRWQRVAIRVGYYWRRVRRQAIIDGRAYGVVTPADEQPTYRVRIRDHRPDDDPQELAA